MSGCGGRKYKINIQRAGLSFNNELVPNTIHDALRAIDLLIPLEWLD
jgi:hypothetical protein